VPGCLGTVKSYETFGKATVGGPVGPMGHIKSLYIYCGILVSA
jgi:hypothetical protein